MVADELSDIERRGLQLIQDTGGIHQSEFWKKLDISSRKGSRIVDSLLDQELINREETVHNSRKEHRGLQLIQDTGGIHQSEFWKELDISSRKGSRIVDSLLDQELINREETVHNSRKTYYLEPTAEELDFRLLMAGDMLSPLIGNEEIDPQSDSFSQWLMNLQYDE